MPVFSIEDYPKLVTYAKVVNNLLTPTSLTKEQPFQNDSYEVFDVKLPMPSPVTEAEKLAIAHNRAYQSSKEKAVSTQKEEPVSPKYTIFLAEVTDDLEEDRQEVQRYLIQQGVHILPSTTYLLDNIESYIPFYKPHIFVSYASVDNEILPETDKGWVTTLIDELKILLVQKLDNSDTYSFWMDKNLRDSDSLTPEIVKQLENSAIFLLILSSSYFTSKQCLLELNTFLAKIGKGSGRIFIIELEEMQYPEYINDLLGYQLWITDDTGKSRTLTKPALDPSESRYYRIFDDLVRNLDDTLKSLKISSNFLGIKQSLDQDLAKCDLFVQLLSDKTDFGLPQFQYERAKAMDLPIVQSRDRIEAINSVLDSVEAILFKKPQINTSRRRFKDATLFQKAMQGVKPLKADKVALTNLLPLPKQRYLDEALVHEDMLSENNDRVEQAEAVYVLIKRK